MEPLIPPNAALIVVLPLATLVTSPTLLIVAVVGLEELQTTELEMSCVLLSLKLPVAVNCLVVPTGMFEVAGVTTIETKLAAVIVSDAVPLTEPEAAVIVVVPAPALFTSPFESTVAVEVAEEDHVKDGNSWVLPSSKMPTAVNCCDVPRAID